MMLRRLISGNTGRRTRLHNHDGKLLDAGGLRYLPRCLRTTLAVKVTRRRPELPWIGFRAIERLDGLIQPEWQVLEFGSGMSTIWLARRCARLISVETDSRWHDKISALLREAALENVDYRLRERAEAHLVEDCADGTFDFVLVDGVRRDLAAATALKKIKPAGYIYLDNTDAPVATNQVAKSLLLGATGGGANVSVFNDLTPARVCVTEGMLFRLPGHS